MLFVLVGLVLLAMKLSGWGFAAPWEWWWILAPFVLALIWWAWADASGLTRRRAMDREEERKALRRRRSVEALGMGTKSGSGTGGKKP